jgi:hypothetical protein
MAALAARRIAQERAPMLRGDWPEAGRQRQIWWVLRGRPRGMNAKEREAFKVKMARLVAETKGEGPGEG